MSNVERQPDPTIAAQREEARLAELRSFDVLDTDPEPIFDELVELAVEACGTPMGMISLLDDSRQWLKAKIGPEVCQTDRGISFCRFALDRTDPFIVPNAMNDPRFANSSLVTDSPHMRFYAGVPLITRRGHALGTLCVMDTEPRDLTPRQIHTLERLARQVTQQLEFRRTTRLLRDEMTIRRQSEESLRRTNRVLTELAQHESMYLGDLGSALTVIAEAAALAMNVESVGIRLQDTVRGRLELVHQHLAPGRAHSLNDDALSRDDVSGELAGRSLRPLRRDDVEHDAYVHRRFRSMPADVHHALDVAIRITGRVVGLFSIETTDAARVWSLEDETIAVMFSSLVALSLETAERHETAEQLRQAKMVIERSPTILFRWRPEPGWPVELVSDNVVQIGYRPKLFLSGELLFADIVHPEDLERVKAEVQAYLASGIDRFMQKYRIICGDGRIAWLEDHTVVDRNAEGRVRSLQGILMDVSERKQAETELARAHASNQAILDAATEVSIMATDIDGVITTFNTGSEKMLGYTAQEVVGRHTLLLFHLPEEVEAHGRQVSQELGRTVSGIESFVERAKQTGTDRNEWTFVRKDGSRIRVELVLTVVRDTDGRPAGVLGLSRDITAWKQAEAALADAKLTAESANHAKSAFLANMSHEIRTPMTAILGFTDLLHDATLPDEERAQALDSIRRNGMHLLALINDVLDHSKIEAGGMSVEPLHCNPVQLVREVEDAMRHRAQAQGLEFDVRFDGAIPSRISTDPLRLRQILLNLVGNAIKFTHEGRVELNVSVETGKQILLRFVVRDSGVGMDQDQLARLFKPFSQADASTTRRFGGTGLGLAISKGLAEQLGGDLVAVSAPGEGSTFTLTIDPNLLRSRSSGAPIADALQRTPDASRLADATGSTVLAGMRVLVAEDGSDNQRLLRVLLTRSGAEVELVNNGRCAVREAFDAVNAGKPFHCVLMDMQMPILDGYDATRELRARGYDGVIIAVTANAMAHDRGRCLDAGCDDYLSKPVDRQSLRDMLRRYMPSLSLRRGPAA